MDRRLQILVVAVVVIALVAIYALSAGWFSRPNSAEITFCVVNDEGDDTVEYWVKMGPPPLPLSEGILYGEVAPGETDEVTVDYEWDGEGSAGAYVMLELFGQISEISKRYEDGAYVDLIPGGRYRIECHIYINPEQTDMYTTIEDVYMLLPYTMEPFAGPYSGTLSLDIRNSIADDWNRFDVYVDGTMRAVGVLGPQSSMNLTIPVPMGLDGASHCSIEVWSGQSWDTEHAELVLVEEGMVTTLTISV